MLIFKHIIFVFTVVIFFNPIFAQDSTSIQDQDIEEIVVTGSYLKTSPTDGASPVDVIDRESIENFGVNTVADLTRNLASNSGSENVYLYLAPEEYGGHSEVAQYCLISAYQICEDNYKSILSKGDLNKDQIFNIQDILMIIDLILHDENNNDLLLWVSDINNDQEISVLDVILLTSLILEANNE